MRIEIKSWFILVTLVLVTFASEAFASDVSKISHAPMKGNVNQSIVSKPVNAFVDVTLYVEIPSQRYVFRHHVTAFHGSTVSQVLESAYVVKHGLVCCDSRDIWAINGLAVDPYQEKWWIIKVNGNSQNTSSQTKVYDGDTVELIYEEKTFYPATHVRLEDWISQVKK